MNELETTKNQATGTIVELSRGEAVGLLALAGAGGYAIVNTLKNKAAQKKQAEMQQMMMMMQAMQQQSAGGNVNQNGTTP